MDGIHDDLRDISQTHDFNFINPKAGVFYNINEVQESGFVNIDERVLGFRAIVTGEIPGAVFIILK